MSPPQPQQVVPQCLGQEALRPELWHAHGAMALRQLRPVRAVDQRDVRELRSRPTHRLEYLNLAERVGQVVIAPDHMADRHVVVVHHHSVQVGRRAVAPQDDEVVQFRVAHPHLALHEVPHHRLALLRRAQPDDWRHPRRRLGGIAVPPAPVVPGRPTLGYCQLPHRAQLVRRAVAAIRPPGRQQLQRDLRVTRGPRGLEHWRCVRGDAHPGQPVQDALRVFGQAAGTVRVLDADQELAAVMAAEQVVEQRGPYAADMQQAGRAGGEAGANGHGGVYP